MKIFYFLFFMLLCTTGNAQYVKFATSGIITYEKRANMYAIIKSNINKDNETYMQKSFENYQKTQPQFKTSISTLTFTQNQSLYKPGENNETVNNIFLFPAFEQNNLVYTDIASKISWSQKKVFEETFLVKDSLRNIKWKITDETRNIAGYECQRANAIIMDSIYVVAFYTDEIIATGGPESFTGLPGMILGIALPHEHVTWFATQVVDKPVALKELNPPIKGTPVNRNTLKNSLQNSFKNYNKFIQDALRFYLL